MKIFSSKKRVAIIGAVTAVTLVGGGTAFAYWTTTGSGTGSATVGTGDVQITVTGTATADLTPGGPGSPVTFTANNPASFNQRLTKIHLTGITTDLAHASCARVLGVDFYMADVDPVESDGNLAPGFNTLDAQGELLMLDSGANQNACQGAPLTLAFATS